MGFETNAPKTTLKIAKAEIAEMMNSAENFERESIVDKYIQKLGVKRYELIDDFALAYLAETGLSISEVELCEVIDSDDPYKITGRWFFRKKQ